MLLPVFTMKLGQKKILNIGKPQGCVTFDVKSQFLMYMILRVRLPNMLLPVFTIDLGIKSQIRPILTWSWAFNN